ncbi:unnamed protein product, partial [Rotaria magnacalcarata]
MNDNVLTCIISERDTANRNDENEDDKGLLMDQSSERLIYRYANDL